MATLAPPNDPARPRDSPTFRRLEDRIKTLESEMKKMREAFDKEIKELKDELRQLHADEDETMSPAVAVADPVNGLSFGSSADAPTPTPTPPPSRPSTPPTPPWSASVGAEEQSNGPDAAGRPGNATILAAAGKTTSILIWLVFYVSAERSASHLYENCKREFEDPPAHGLTEKQATRKMLIGKEGLDEAKRTLASELQSAKERIVKLWEDVRSDAAAAAAADTDNPLDGGGNTMTGFQNEICVILKDVKGAIESYDVAEATLVEQERKREAFMESIDWSKFRLTKLQNDMKSLV